MRFAASIFLACLVGSASAQITPESFGAKGDGRTDDSVAFTKAIAAVSAQGGGVVYLSQKAYVVSGVQLPSDVTMEGVPHAPMLTLSSPSATIVPCTVLRSPLAGGVVVTINGTASAPVLSAGVENVVFEGPAGSQGLPAATPSQGLKVGPFSEWASCHNCTFEFFGDQGVIGGGAAFTATQLRTVYNLRKQPRTRMSAGAEFYGTDPKVYDFEFSGELGVETAMVDPALQYNCAMLVQSTQGFYSVGVAEAGDIGLAVVGKVNAAPLADGSDYPQENYNNKFNLVRADHNWGNGWEFLTMNGAYVYDATASNCWADGNGQDKTSQRTSIVTGSLSSVSDANWIVQGVRVKLVGCSATSYEMTPPNVNYGMWLNSKPGPIDAYNSASDFTTAGQGRSYLIASSVSVVK